VAYHARKQIRDLAVAALTNLATTQDRVYSGRARPLTPAQMPALMIYAIDEHSVLDAKGKPATLLRTLTLAIEGKAGGSDSALLDDTLDQIADEVEAVLGAGTLHPRILNQTLIGSRLSAQAPGESQLGV